MSKFITGDEEAKRTMLGIRSGLPQGITDLLALDIGGGSTEFILAQQGQPPVVRSIDIGVVRLSERLLHHDPPTREETEQARVWIRRETTEALARHAAIGRIYFRRDRRHDHLIGGDGAAASRL